MWISIIALVCTMVALSHQYQLKQEEFDQKYKLHTDNCLACIMNNECGYYDALMELRPKKRSNFIDLTQDDERPTKKIKSKNAEKLNNIAAKYTGYVAQSYPGNQNFGNSGYYGSPQGPNGNSYGMYGQGQDIPNWQTGQLASPSPIFSPGSAHSTGQVHPPASMPTQHDFIERMVDGRPAIRSRCEKCTKLSSKTRYKARWSTKYCPGCAGEPTMCPECYNKLHGTNIKS